MATDIEICGKSLLKIGETPISAFDSGTEVSDTCGTLYPDFAKHCLTMYPWTFARKKAQLARLNETPLNKWKYAYQLPTSDFLKLLAVYDSSAVGARPVVGYEILYDKVFTDYSEVYIDYTFDCAEEDWPGYFVEFVATAFAAELAIPITNQDDLHDRLWTKAYGTVNDNLNGGLFGLAKKVDSQQVPSKVIQYSSIINSRFSGFR